MPSEPSANAGFVRAASRRAGCHSARFDWPGCPEDRKDFFPSGVPVMPLPVRFLPNRQLPEPKTFAVRREIKNLLLALTPSWCGLYPPSPRCKKRITDGDIHTAVRRDPDVVGAVEIFTAWIIFDQHRHFFIQRQISSTAHCCRSSGAGDEVAVRVC